MSEASGIARSLKADGQAMTLTRINAATTIFDAVSSSVSYGEAETYTVHGITTNYNSQTRIASQNDPNSMILGGDKKVIIGAGVVVPVPGDKLTIMGVQWVVISVDALAPQGADLLYTCQVRL